MAIAPQISVIIPHLNQHDFLRRCLLSLEQQSFDRDSVEIIVVDNGSKQLPTDVCKSFGVRLEQEPEPGPGPARNTGVALSSAKILAFIDADCLAHENWLTTIAKTLCGEDCTQVIGGDVRIACEDPGTLTMLEAYESIYAYRQKDYIERQGFSGTGNLAMQRSVYDAVGPFGGIEIAEDRDWGHRATRQGYAIEYIPQMIVFHPARKTFSELCTKWDRQLSHDFEEQVNGGLGYLRWMVKAIAMAASPVFELPRLATSDRVTTRHQRRLAALALTRIRFYRSWQMLRLSVTGKRGAGSSSWNRK